LHIGYVSPDFRRHTMAAFIEPILTHHDRKKVTVFAYAEVEHPDEVTERLNSLADQWRWTIGQSDQQVAELVRADGIDILIDLAGHTSGNRLRVFALRPAPVQATYLGYPNTTGLDAVDYRITDADTDPPDEPRRHTEELIRLPSGFACFAPPANAPAISPSPALQNGFITFGSIHNLAKLNDQVLDLWCSVLKATPTSRLVVSRHTLVGRVRDEFMQRFSGSGVDPNRIVLRHATDADAGFLSAFHQFDIMLDTFPWGANTTTYESLWMGVPILTLCGDRHAGRWAATIQPRLGLEEFVARSQDEFVARAVETSKHMDRLAEARRNLRERMRASPLCDGPGLCRKLEAAYRTMWERTVQ
jgi:predicted O-linked N-acetylglucosamine transferase (SPINDLY family)